MDRPSRSRRKSLESYLCDEPRESKIETIAIRRRDASVPERRITGKVSTEELRQRYDLREEHFAHLGMEVSMVMPKQADLLIDEAEFGADERLPYWADLWPAARALTREILEWDQEALPSRALELGCGLGLPSLALRWRGVPVLATDYYLEALAFVAENARRNGIEAVQCRLLDWREIPRDFPRAPLLLAADVLYESRNGAPLLAALDRLLEHAGRAIIADPGRVYLAPFRALAAEGGWQVRTLPEREEQAVAAGSTTVVRLLQLTR